MRAVHAIGIVVSSFVAMTFQGIDTFIAEWAELQLLSQLVP
jgi:hypothetical protein